VKAQDEVLGRPTYTTRVPDRGPRQTPVLRLAGWRRYGTLCTIVASQMLVLKRCRPSGVCVIAPRGSG